MGDTNIEWADRVWNPIAGCSIVSPGCTNCYAMKMAHRIEGMNAALGRRNHYAGLTTKSKAGAVWTGKVAVAADNIFLAPLSWKKPARVFANSMADLFHEDVPDDVIDRAFAVMALCPHLTFMVLTKRADRMCAYFADAGAVKRIIHQAFKLDQPDGAWLSADHEIAGDPILPLPNVWLGVSVEDQRRADERIPHLLATPAAKRFISAEPLLGPVDLRPWFSGEYLGSTYNDGHIRRYDLSGEPVGGLDWVIAGGESGPKARAARPDWFRSLRDQCAATGVPFFFKQWGEWAPLDGTGLVSEQPDAKPKDDIYRIGKKRAGALLDGKLHREFPT